MKRLMTLSMALCAYISFGAIASAQGEQLPPQKEWNVYVYMGADNNLHDYARGRLTSIRNAMKKPEINEKVSVAVFMDGAGYANGDGSILENHDIETSFEHTSSPGTEPDSYYLSFTNEGEKRVFVGERNSVDARNIISFGRWAKRALPKAKKTIFIIMSHGLGVSSPEYDDAPLFDQSTETYIETLPDLKKGNSRSIVVDYGSGDAYASNRDVASALLQLKHEGLNIDLIFFDACLMATLGVAYEFKDVSPLLVFSPNTLSSVINVYDNLLLTLSKNTDTLFLRDSLLAFFKKTQMESPAYQSYMISFDTSHIARIASLIKESINSFPYIFAANEYPISQDDAAGTFDRLGHKEISSEIRAAIETSFDAKDIGIYRNLMCLPHEPSRFEEITGWSNYIKMVCDNG